MKEERRRLVERLSAVPVDRFAVHALPRVARPAVHTLPRSARLAVHTLPRAARLADHSCTHQPAQLNAAIRTIEFSFKPEKHAAIWSELRACTIYQMRGATLCDTTITDKMISSP